MHHFIGLLLEKAPQAVASCESTDIQSLYRKCMIRRERCEVQVLNEQIGENRPMNFELDRKFLRSRHLLNYELCQTKQNRLVKNDQQQNGDREPTEKVS
jgi:hypothetical protein